MPIPISQNLQLAGQSDVTPWELPYKELAFSLQQKQATQDKGREDIAAQGELAAKLQSLSQDRLEAMNIVNNVYDQSAMLSEGVDLTTPEGRKAVTGLKESVRREFSPGGKAHAIESNLNTFTEWDKRQQERLKSGKITQAQYDQLRNYTLGNYQGVGEFNPQTGAFNSIQVEEAADYVDTAERIKDLVKDVKANAVKTTTDDITKDPKWVIKTVDGTEEVTEERIMEIAIQKLLTDDKTKNYLAQAQKIGLIPEGSFYDPNTGQATPYVLQYPVNKKGEVLSIDQLNNMTEQEKADLYIREELNPNHYLYSIIRGTAQELGFKKTEFARTRTANDYHKISFKHNLENSIVDLQFDSQGFKINTQGGNTPEKVNTFIKSTEGAAQSVIDQFLSNNTNTEGLVGQITPEQWLSGNMSEDLQNLIANSFTPEAIRSVTADLNRKAIILDKEKQRLQEAEIKSGKGELNKEDLRLENYINKNYPNGLILPTGEILDLREVSENITVYSAVPGVNNVLPVEFRRLVNNRTKSYQDYKERLNKEIKGSSIGSASVTQSPIMPGVDPSDKDLQAAYKRQLNQMIGNPANFGSFMVRISDADLATLQAFTGKDLNKYKQNGEIPASELSKLGVNVKAIGDEKNINFTDQPIGDRRYASKPYVFTNANKETVEISTLFPIGDGNNGTVGTPEIGNFLNSPEAQAQEMILYVKNTDNIKQYSPSHVPGLTILKDGKGSINVKLGGVNRNYTEREGVAIISQALATQEAKLNIRAEKPEKGAAEAYIKSIEQFARDNDISFLEAKKVLDQSQKK
jgi:hypothetical protein